MQLTLDVRRTLTLQCPTPRDYAISRSQCHNALNYMRMVGPEGPEPGTRGYESERSPGSAALDAPGDYDPLVQEL